MASEPAPASGGSAESAPKASPDRQQAEAYARAQFAARRAFKRSRRRALNPYYVSLRSLLITAAIVLLLALAIIAAAVSMRGEPLPPSTEPRIEILTAPGSAADAAPSEPPAAGAGAAQSLEIILAAETPARLDMEGPPVPTVIITNTPLPLAVGLRAEVFNVGADELNVRNIPSVRESQILFRAPAGTRFDIIGGPQEADGYTWWQLRDGQYQVQGWAVAKYLLTVSESGG